MPEDSHQSHEQTNKKKREHTNLMKFSNCLRPQDREERDIIKSVKYKIQSIGNNTPIYIAIEPMKVRKPKTLSSDQKRILNPTWKLLRD